MPFTEKVMRKKLYKVGKSWVVGGVCAFALTASFALATPSVLGDSSVPDVSANNVQSASDNTTDTQQNTTVTEENDKVQSAATNDNVTTAASDTTQSADNNVTKNSQMIMHLIMKKSITNKMKSLKPMLLAKMRNQQLLQLTLILLKRQLTKHNKLAASTLKKTVVGIIILMMAKMLKVYQR